MQFNHVELEVAEVRSQSPLNRPLVAPAASSQSWWWGLQRRQLSANKAEVSIKRARRRSIGRHHSDESAACRQDPCDLADHLLGILEEHDGHMRHNNVDAGVRQGERLSPPGNDLCPRRALPKLVG